jgi:regulatory protein
MIEQPDINPDSVKKLRQRALRLLSRREYSRHELRNRLTSGPVMRRRNSAKDEEPPTAAEVEIVLAELDVHDLQSDERYAQSVARTRSNREGTARVAHRLKEHKIDPALTETLLAELSRTEYDRALAMWERKFGEVPQLPAERARQMRYLAYRGFSSDVISKIVHRRSA